MTHDVCITFSVFDGDHKHFSRFIEDLTRVGFPYAVNFDHCSKVTRDLFAGNDLFVGGYINDDPGNLFDESHRQKALEIAYKLKFGWVLQMDVDETLEPGTSQQIQERVFTTIDDALGVGCDAIDCAVLDLWQDPEHYRVDGTFQSSHREKMFHLGTNRGKWKYYHPTVHAPKIASSTEGGVKLFRADSLYILHWGIMDVEDVREHTERWNKIYTRAVGGNPYQFYDYLNDPDTVPVLREVEETLVNRSRR